MAPPSEMLCLAIFAVVIIMASSVFFTFGVRQPEPLVGLVAAWAFMGIAVELADPVDLDDPYRFNFHMWSDVDVNGLRYACWTAFGLALVLSFISTTSLAHTARLSSEAKREIEAPAESSCAIEV